MCTFGVGHEPRTASTGPWVGSCPAPKALPWAGLCPRTERAVSGELPLTSTKFQDFRTREPRTRIDGISAPSSSLVFLPPRLRSPATQKPFSPKNGIPQYIYTVARGISDGFGLRKPSHSETIPAKKRYTIIHLYRSTRHFRRFWVKEAPSFRKKIRQKTVYHLLSIVARATAPNKSADFGWGQFALALGN